MRLWHEKIIHLLPKNQLLGQHRECCALRGNGWKKKLSLLSFVVFAAATADIFFSLILSPFPAEILTNFRPWFLPIILIYLKKKGSAKRRYL